MLFNIFYIAVGIFALGFCIFIHELGHFLAAKKRGLIADRFSIGFGPRLFGWHKNGTDFRISLLPFGGYVSLPQLADMGRIEGGEGDEADRLPPISYADKMIVAVMGAVFNLILAFILSLILWGVGREVIKSTTVGHVAEQVVNADREVVPGPAYVAGLREGDVIVTIDGSRVRDWWHYENALVTGVGREDEGEKRPEVKLEVLREGQPLEFTVYPILRKIATDKIRYIGIAPETKENPAPLVMVLEEDMPAIQAGLQSGDRLIELDGNPIISGAFLNMYLSKNGENTIEVTVDRKGEQIVIPIKPRIKEGEDRLRFGFSYDYDYNYKTEIVHINPAEQILLFANTMKRTLVALVHKDSNVQVRNMSGPVGIVHGLTRMAELGPIDLVWMLAFINVNLAIFNLLPIPVLDGGHMLFATISKLIGRPLPRRIMENVQVGFMVLLLGFVLYVSFFDVSRVGYDIGLIEEDHSPIENTTEPESEGAPEEVP